jgi:hypothetical protein
MSWAIKCPRKKGARGTDDCSGSPTGEKSSESWDGHTSNRITVKPEKIYIHRNALQPILP